MSAEAIEQLSPLARDLRAQNPDRYLATLFAPPTYRRSLIALYAFDQEIARAQWTLREPMAGLIRLQWWQDVIDGFSKREVVAHPVVQALRHAVNQDGLEKAHMERAIEARRRPLEEDEPPDPEAFERHLLDVGGSISCAASALLGGNGPEALALADHVGLVSAALEQLHFLQKPRPDAKVWLPTAWVEESGAEAGGDPHLTAQRHLAERALAALAKARRHQVSNARSSLPALFPATLAGLRLRDPVRVNPLQPLKSAVPRLIWCWMLRRF